MGLRAQELTVRGGQDSRTDGLGPMLSEQVQGSGFMIQGWLLIRGVVIRIAGYRAKPWGLSPIAPKTRYLVRLNDKLTEKLPRPEVLHDPV